MIFTHNIMYVRMYTDINECDIGMDNCNTETTMCADTACGFDCIPCPGIIHISPKD